MCFNFSISKKIHFTECYEKIPKNGKKAETGKESWKGGKVQNPPQYNGWTTTTLWMRVYIVMLRVSRSIICLRKSW